VTANNEAPPMTIRVNSRRAGRGAYLVELRDARIPASPAPHANQGLVLASPMDGTALPGFRMGAVSIQDTAAQLAAPLLGVQAGHYVLDACAAPGGKAAHRIDRVARVGHGGRRRIREKPRALCSHRGAPSRLGHTLTIRGG
jgi:16S rRNA (cytosine967-C5)-methyltransferase